MELKSVYLKNFRCFKDSGKIPIHDLTIFIGENDAGKSSILDAMSIFWNEIRFTKDDFYANNNEQAEQSEFIMEFQISDIEIEQLGSLGITEKEFELTLVASLVDDKIEAKYIIEVEQFEDIRLRGLQKKLLTDIRELAKSFALNHNQKIDPLRNEIGAFVKDFPKVKEPLELQFREIGQYLPILQRYSTTDLGNPINQIQSALQEVYKARFYTDTNQQKLLEPLQNLKDEITKDLNRRIEIDLKDIVTNFNPKIKNIKGSIDIDFSSGFRLPSLLLDMGNGLRPIQNRGEGVRKRLFLAILKWQKEIQKELKIERGIIRCYDEPDANLHFNAQKEVYQSISEKDENTQVVICTHSLAMIDNAPARQINQMVFDKETECSTVHYLKTNVALDTKDFFDDISDIFGLKNSSYFYDKCFVLVEGKSEEYALPILYKRLNLANKNKSTLAREGVKIVNMETNSAWSNWLKLLESNKRNQIIIYVDSDTQESNREIKKQRLMDLGFDSDFFDNQVILAGKNEFEDEFPLKTILATLNNEYPKSSGVLWKKVDIDPLYTGKFSDNLIKEIKKECGWKPKKQEIAVALSKQISPPEINQLKSVIKLFRAIENILR